MSLSTRTSILALIVFIPFLAGAQSASPQGGGEVSQGHASPPANYEDIGWLIQTFAKSHDASDGQRALDALEHLSLGPPCVGDGKPCPQVMAPDSNFSPITTLWLKFFVVLDATEASLAKNLEVPVTQVLPPGENGKPSPYIGQVSL